MFRIFTDQCGNTTALDRLPSRIISLVPSQTELLFDLGLGHQLVGITRYCTRPVGAKNQINIVGGTKNFDIACIKALHPDLIIGNKEENDRHRIRELQKDYPVWMSDIFDMKDALAMIRAVGEMTGTQERSSGLSNEIRASFSKLKKTADLRTLYLIWKKPWMAAAANTFIDSMLNLIGLRNCLSTLVRYPELTEGQIRQMSPDLIMLSSEPFPFREKHIEELQSICPASQVILVDGEMFSWYGSRLRFAPAYFNSLPLLRS